MDTFQPSDWLRFIRLHLFEDEWSDLGLDDDDLRLLERAVMSGPTHAPVVKGAGGLRKIRFADPHSNRGKSGAYRIGYAYFPRHGTVLLVTVWGKNEKSNLTKADCTAIAEVIREIQDLLVKGNL